MKTKLNINIFFLRKSANKHFKVYIIWISIGKNFSLKKLEPEGRFELP